MSAPNSVSPQFNSDQEQLAALAAPFPSELHHQRQEGGKTFTYLEHATVTERLREVLGSGMTIRTGQVLTQPSIPLNDTLQGYVDMEVIIEATLVSGRTMVVSGWGEADILATKPKSEQDYRDGKKRGRANQPLKSAFSDGLKVAAARLGVGAYLYTEGGRQVIEQAQKEQKEVAQTQAALTCQGCEGLIGPGTYLGVTYDDPMELMKATRKAYKRRLCLACATTQSIA